MDPERTQRFIALFHREATLLSGLDHPGRDDVIAPIPPIAPLPAAPAAGGTAAAGTGDSFSGSISNALQQVQQSQNTASTAEAQAAAGQGSVTDAMIDATQASLDTQVTVALVDKGVSAFTDIMNMQF